MQRSCRKFNAEIFHRMKSSIVIGIFLALVALCSDFINASATIKPFVRSRYSKRWRIVQTTESNVMNNTLTTETQQGNVASWPNAETTIANNVASVVDATTIDKPTLPLSTTMFSVSKATPQNPRKGGFSTTTEHPRHPGGNGIPLDYDYYGNGGENEDEAAPK